MLNIKQGLLVLSLHCSLSHQLLLHDAQILVTFDYHSDNIKLRFPKIKVIKGLGVGEVGGHGLANLHKH